MQQLQQLVQTMANNVSAHGCDFLQAHPTSPPAAAVPPELMQQLQQLVQTLAPTFVTLLNVCDNVPVAVGANRAREAAAFQAFLQGVAQGWLSDGLQKVGAAVWAAWPQRYVRVCGVGCWGGGSAARLSAITNL